MPNWPLARIRSSVSARSSRITFTEVCSWNTKQEGAGLLPTHHTYSPKVAGITGSVFSSLQVSERDACGWAVPQQDPPGGTSGKFFPWLEASHIQVSALSSWGISRPLSPLSKGDSSPPPFTIPLLCTLNWGSYLRLPCLLYVRPRPPWTVSWMRGGALVCLIHRPETVPDWCMQSSAEWVQETLHTDTPALWAGTEGRLDSGRYQAQPLRDIGSSWWDETHIKVRPWAAWALVIQKGAPDR